MFYIFQELETSFLKSSKQLKTWNLFTESYEGTTHWLEGGWKGHARICRRAPCTSTKKQLTVKANGVVWVVICLHCAHSPPLPTTGYWQGKTWMVTTYIGSWNINHRYVDCVALLWRNEHIPVLIYHTYHTTSGSSYHTVVCCILYCVYTRSFILKYNLFTVVPRHWWKYIF